MYGSVSFNRGWEDYVQGFGTSTGDYWTGLQNIYYLTSSGKIGNFFILSSMLILLLNTIFHVI